MLKLILEKNDRKMTLSEINAEYGDAELKFSLIDTYNDVVEFSGWTTNVSGEKIKIVCTIGFNDLSHIDNHSIDPKIGYDLETFLNYEILDSIQLYDSNHNCFYADLNPAGYERN